MKATATDLRKNLFTLLEESLKGQSVEVSYKGRIIRLVPEQAGLKLARLTSRPLFTDSGTDLTEELAANSREVAAAWEDKWASR